MRQIIIIFLILIGFSACNTYEKVLHHKDVVYKFTKANEYYDKGKWFEASRIYESIIPVFRGTKDYEEIYYRLAYSFYNDGDYLNAAYQFKNFSEYFTKSDRAEEMEFMYGVSLFKDSRKMTLDQSETEKAIAALQSFVNVHSDSKFVSQANNYLDSAFHKIEMKDAAAAKQYFNLEDYKSASVAYKTLIFDFPDSKELDYYYFMVVRSLFEYAERSKEQSQRARYSEAVNHYELLKTYYPNSRYFQDAEKYNSIALTKINKLKEKDEHK